MRINIHTLSTKEELEKMDGGSLDNGLSGKRAIQELEKQVRFSKKIGKRSDDHAR